MFAPAMVVGALTEQTGTTLPALLFAACIALGAYWLRTLVRAGMFAALALGMLSAYLHRHVVHPPIACHTITMHGTVIEATENQGYTSFTLRSDTGLRLEAVSNDAGPPIGSRITLRGRPEAFGPARNPGEASPQARAQERGLDAHILHARILSVMPPDLRDPHVWLPLARAWAATSIRTRVEEPYASILAGALWGERGALPPDLRAEFQDTGTVHVLVTAGLHLGVIAALAGASLTYFGVGRIASSLLSIPVVWFYAAFSGAHLPALRAAVMASFALLARAAGREALSWDALGAGAIVITLMEPSSVLSISFALSFSCVGAIILFAAPIKTFLENVHLPQGATEAIALTVATQIGTWPLTATAFLLFAPYAPLANALIVPVIGIVMLLGIAELCVAPFGYLAQGLANINTSLLMWVVGVARTIASFPYAHIIVTPPPTWTIFVYDASLLLCARLLAQQKYRAAAAFFTCACVLLITPPHLPRHDLLITAIDVGQADALLIQTPRGHVFLVDAGGRLERGTQQHMESSAEAVGERVVIPFLIRQGIHHLNGIILSHPHGDHAGGVAPTLKNLGADFFADSGQQYAGHAYHDALNTTQTLHIPLITPHDGDVWQTDDGVTLRFYGPSLPFLRGTHNDINNNSVVFRLEYQHFRMLFTGDIGREAEERILAHGDNVRAEILKVGHHGSAYSSTSQFLKAVSPRAAIISVGANNLFGHPARRTIIALQAIGAQIYRTDEQGALTIRSDGNTVSVTPFLIRGVDQRPL
jgi:competence protein ComEC